MVGLNQPHSGLGLLAVGPSKQAQLVNGAGLLHTRERWGDEVLALCWSICRPVQSRYFCMPIFPSFEVALWWPQATSQLCIFGQSMANSLRQLWGWSKLAVWPGSVLSFSLLTFTLLMIFDDLLFYFPLPSLQNVMFHFILFLVFWSALIINRKFSVA